MHPADIQAALKKKGYSQAKLARELGLHPVSISRVILGKEVSNRIMNAVAVIIGQPVQFIFPDYYLSPPKRKTSAAFGPINPNR